MGIKMMLAVDNSLIKDVVNIFIKKEKIIYNEKIGKLFKYIQPPIAIGKFQIPSDIRIVSQSQGIIKFINAKNELELAKKTHLKLILSDKKSDFPYVDINQDEFEVNFTATYTQRSNKQKVLEHLKNLIQNGDKIQIYDKYLLNDNGDSINTSNHYSVLIINQLIDNLTTQRLEIFCKDRGNDSNETERINQRKSHINYTDLSFCHSNLTDHDRYIKILDNDSIKKYEIILSSGLYNILGNKDFTYVVRTF